MTPDPVTASAPVRLDFAGGWTDVAPFAAEHRGMVVNAAIELRVRVEIVPGGTAWVLHAEDLGATLVARDPAALVADGHLDLLKAAVRRSGLGPATVRTRSDVPPGSGLGSSGALDVALVAACDAVLDTRRPPAEVAEEGWRLEAVDAALAGGRQDQYAAALGGFHRFTFEQGQVGVESLHLDAAFRATLASHIVICYTGVSRVSSDTIARVMAGYRRGDRTIVTALHGMVEVAGRMARALAGSDLVEVGGLLSENWAYQQQLDPGMRTSAMAELESAMRPAGVLGGKAAGAGAGGSMFFVVEDPARAVRAAGAAGARVMPFTWADEGVRVA
jgi:D-glycero-alpha-D-manno-heptose-7-phosphate kinase